MFIADDTHLSMPDTPQNQASYPQPQAQQAGIGFPLARLAVRLSLATWVQKSQVEWLRIRPCLRRGRQPPTPVLAVADEAVPAPAEMGCQVSRVGGDFKVYRRGEGEAPGRPL